MGCREDSGVQAAVVVGMGMAPKGHISERLVTREGQCVSRGGGSRRSQLARHGSLLHPSPLHIQHLSCPPPCSLHHDNGLSLWNCKPPPTNRFTSVSLHCKIVVSKTSSLFFQRTQVQFPSPTLDGSQPPGAELPREDLTPSLASEGNCIHVAQTQTHR